MACGVWSLAGRLRLVGLALTLVLSLSLLPWLAAAQVEPEAPAPVPLLPGEVLAVCWPWAVMPHGLYSLPSGLAVSPWFGLAGAAFCSGGYIVVVAEDAVYIVEAAGGSLVDLASLPEGGFVAGVASGAVALVEPERGVVQVEAPGPGDFVIPLPPVSWDSVVDIEFGASGPSVYVAVLAEEPGGERSLWIALPHTAGRVLEGVSPVDVDALEDGRLLVAYPDGRIEVYMVDVDSLRLAMLDSFLVPYELSRIAGFIEGAGVILVETGGGSLVAVYPDGSWDFAGPGEATPAGVYSPESDASTLFLETGEVAVVRGRAVAVLGGSLAVTNVEVSVGDERAVLGALWPLRAAVLVALESVEEATLVVPGGYTLRVSLGAGPNLLPLGSTLIIRGSAVPIVEAEQYWPEKPGNPHGGSSGHRAAALRQVSVRVPENYVPSERVEGVVSAWSGGGKVVAITRGEAIVIAEYGVVARIPGRWLWAGAGLDAVALYDGAAVRVFDLAGNPLAAYPVAIEGTPIHVSVDGLLVKVALPGAVVELSPAGVKVVEAPGVRAEELPSGAVLEGAVGGRLTFRVGELSFPVPPAAHVAVNMLQVAWQGEGGYWGVADLGEGTVYTIIGGWEAPVWPLGDYIAVLTPDGALEVLPFKSWALGECFVRVVAPEEATVLVDGREAGRGEVVVYAECGEVVTVEAVMEYHRPDRREVLVREGGVTVELSPEPILALVRLAVDAPPELLEFGVVEGMLVSVNGGEPVEVEVGGVLELIAGPEYTLQVVEWTPFNVCEPVTLEGLVFEEGEQELVVQCMLRQPILVAASQSPAAVNVYLAGEPGQETLVAQGQASPGSPAVFPLQPGLYRVASEPLEEGFVGVSREASLQAPGIVVVDVSPLPYARLVVTVSPATALVRVLALPGEEEVASGTGSLDARLPPGDYLLIASAPGYSSYEEQVTLAPGELSERNIVLRPLAAPQQQEGRGVPIYMQAAIIMMVLGLAGLGLWWRRRRRMRAAAEEAEEA